MDGKIQNYFKIGFNDLNIEDFFTEVEKFINLIEIHLIKRIDNTIFYPLKAYTQSL